LYAVTGVQTCALPISSEQVANQTHTMTGPLTKTAGEPTGGAGGSNARVFAERRMVDEGHAVSARLTRRSKGSNLRLRSGLFTAATKRRPAMNIRHGKKAVRGKNGTVKRWTFFSRLGKTLMSRKSHVSRKAVKPRSSFQPKPDQPRSMFRRRSGSLMNATAPALHLQPAARFRASLPAEHSLPGIHSGAMVPDHSFGRPGGR